MKNEMQLRTINLIALIFFSMALFAQQNKFNGNNLVVKDADGNLYHSVTIGTQVWMTENLKTTKYNDGTPIPLVTDSREWKSLFTPGYCWYNNDEAASRKNYGAIYNWYTVSTGKLCPEGWHVPADSEFGKLTTLMGIAQRSTSIDQGGKAEADGTAMWINPDGTINKSGFVSLAGGYRNYDGSFSPSGSYCHWWASAEWNQCGVWGRFISYGNGAVNSYVAMRDGFSVRCTKNP